MAPRRSDPAVETIDRRAANPAESTVVTMHMTTYTTPPANPRTSRRGGLLRACATAAVLLTGGLAGSAGAASASTDVADAARAAFPDRGGITHYRMHLSYVATSDPFPGLHDLVGSALPQPFGATLDDEPTFAGVIERWSAVAPLRDRSAWLLTLSDGTAATTEESYADSTFRWWRSWTGEPAFEDRLSDAEWEEYVFWRTGTQRRWEHNATWTADPIGGIRTMFENGMLESTGRTVFEGRSVLRLIGQEPGTEANRSPGGPIQYEYLVDPHSFAPVRVSTTRTERAPDQNGENAERNLTTWTFQEFDTLPLNDATRHLLVAGGGH